MTPRTMATVIIENAANGVHGQPICCLSQLAQEDLLISSPTISSTEPSPTRETKPADQKKRKKKKKTTKTVTNDLSPGKPTPDAERPSVLCISRNKHWKYISSYHVRLRLVRLYHLVLRVIRVPGSNSLSSCSSPFSSSTPTPPHSPMRNHTRKLYTRPEPHIQLSTRVPFLVHVKSIEASTLSRTTHHPTPRIAVSTPCLRHIPPSRPHLSCLYQANQLPLPSIRVCSVM